MKEHTSAPPSMQFFVVRGKPTTKNKRRAFVVGGVARVVRDKASKDKQAAFQAVAQAHAPEVPWGGPVCLSFGFYFAPPKGWPKWKHRLRERLGMTSKPDLSRLIVFAEDALCGLFFLDDAQTKELQASKGWAEAPRTEVSITYLPTNPATKIEAETKGLTQ